MQDTFKAHTQDFYSLMILLFNCKSKNISNPKIREYITQIIQYHIDELMNDRETFSPHYNGFFKDSKEIPKKGIFLNQQIIISILDNYATLSETIAVLLESYGFDVIRKPKYFDEFVKIK